MIAASVKLRVFAVRFVATIFVDVKFVENKAPVVILVEIIAEPSTCNFCDGALVPIPTLPELLIRILSLLTV